MAWKVGDPAPPKPNRNDYKPGDAGQKDYDAASWDYQLWENEKNKAAKTRPVEGKFQKNVQGTGVEYVAPPAAAPVIVDTGAGAGDAAKKADADRKATEKAEAEKKAMASPGQTGPPTREQFASGIVGQSAFSAAMKKYQEKMAAQKSTATENQKKNR